MTSHIYNTFQLRKQYRENLSKQNNLVLKKDEKQRVISSIKETKSEKLIE